MFRNGFRIDSIGGGGWPGPERAMALSVPISSGDGVAMQHFAEIVNIYVSTLVGVDENHRESVWGWGSSHRAVKPGRYG